MQKTLLLTAALALTPACPSAAPAQDRLEAGSDIVGANDLIGRSVIGADGEELGTISDFLLSLSGGIDRLIVASGGFLGIVGGREVAIPWSETETGLDTGDIRVTLTRGDFENAPEYQRQGKLGAMPGTDGQ
ncbi:PRC-barrel domain-containing protein [Skermanella mucosa]|uniref:PRC-barrel domain-containing protein n=1 Tax=Skermanella mucosa TaxID=1789672 RepID=UPI00192A8617|nr:PRC-barrel domain-containing protein [Skermanella mucosa]UEM22116.1 PRC-barrel domain-containing protein [Skermanella mucosa]